MSPKFTAEYFPLACDAAAYLSELNEGTFTKGRLVTIMAIDYQLPASIHHQYLDYLIV
jgi:hypothetical protein